MIRSKSSWGPTGLWEETGRCFFTVPFHSPADSQVDLEEPLRPGWMGTFTFERWFDVNLENHLQLPHFKAGIRNSIWCHTSTIVTHHKTSFYIQLTRNWADPQSQTETQPRSLGFCLGLLVCIFVCLLTRTYILDADASAPIDFSHGQSFGFLA